MTFHSLAEAGSGFPLLMIPGGGLELDGRGPRDAPFNPFDEFEGEFVWIAADLRNAKGGQSPVRPRSIGRGTPTPTTISA